MIFWVKIILLVTFFWCVAIGVLHVTPKWRDRWDEMIRKNNLMHLSIGIFVLFLGLVNILLFFSLK